MWVVRGGKECRGGGDEGRRNYNDHRYMVWLCTPPPPARVCVKHVFSWHRVGVRGRCPAFAR